MQHLDENSSDPLTQLYNRVVRALDVGRQEIKLEEWDVVSVFWDALKQLLPEDEDVSLHHPMLEEALVLRILSSRLLYEMEHVPEEGSRTVAFKTSVEAWFKTQERLRKVMKDILEYYGHNENDGPKSLAELMVPILEQGEGILEDALEFEARKKSTPQKKDGKPRRRRVAKTP